MINDPLPPAPESALRPRDFALLLLASGELRPRKRARDQQADRAGAQLKRHLLQTLAALDPEPADLEAALFQIVEQMDPPAGPARALALVVRDEWQTACAAPEWVAHLLEQAVEQNTEDQPRGPIADP